MKVVEQVLQNIPKLLCRPLPAPNVQQIQILNIGDICDILLHLLLHGKLVLLCLPKIQIWNVIT